MHLHHLFFTILFIGILPNSMVWGGSKKTFVYCSEASPTVFNPQIATDGPSHTASANAIYNQLLSHRYGSTELIPSLATSWKISKRSKNLYIEVTQRS